MIGIIDYKLFVFGEGVGCIFYEIVLMWIIMLCVEDFDELGYVNNVVYLCWV